MGLWDSLLGRSRPKAPDLDALFLVPSAAVTLQTTLGLEPTGDGSVCFRAAAGQGFQQTQQEVLDLLRADSGPVEVTVSTDSYGFGWIAVDRPPGSGVEGLCTGLHAVNTSLEAQGFGGGLLCTVIGFEDGSGRRLGLVYLYKQGSFYPFAPTGPSQRDALLEIQVRDVLAGEVPIEQDRSRWLAVWGAPGL